VAPLLAGDAGPDDHAAQATAMETAMTLVTNATAPVASWWNACKKAVGPARGDCRRLAARLADSDALIYALFGARLLELSADDDAARRAARARWRGLHWLMQHAPRIMSGPEWTAADRAFVAALPAEGEIAAIRAFLVASGEAASPPPDFVVPEPPPIK
jgi:hypothetical protein